MAKTIGLMRRSDKKICFTQCDEIIFYSVGNITIDDEPCVAVYAFESNVILFTLPAESSDKKIVREFLKKYKMLPPATCRQMQREGRVSDCDIAA